ncbi:MAG: tetratricopeptide repeat protein [Myxococcales bacterium]|nr:tetratricopeptide repeat protein [Myxococcales bacterium]
MRWFLVPSIVLSLQTLAHGATQGASEQRVLPCQPSQVSDLFPEPTEPRPELRVLITSFYGADEASEAYGHHVGSRMREEVESHARQEIKPEYSGLQYSAIRVKFVPCSVDDHEKARTLGHKAQADVVLWGKAFCSGKNPLACQTVMINSGNTIKDSPGARMKNQSGPVVVQPPDPSTPGRFTTSLTVVRWLGLDANAQSQGQVRRSDQVAALGLPELVSDKPRVLIDVVIGLYAARAERHGLAAELLERAKQDVAAGVDGAAELYRLIGGSYLIAGRKEQGLANLEAALRTCRSVDDRCQSVGLANLGWAVDRLGDKAKALSYYKQALPLWKQVGDRLGEARSLNNIGLVYSDLGDKAKALSYYEQALPLQKQVGDRSGEATTLNNIGAVYDDLGDKQKALSYYGQALPLQKQVGDRLGEARSLNNIGLVYSDRGDKQKALSYYKQALPLRKQVGDRSGEATTLHNIGAVYSDLGDKAKALSYYKQALPLQKQVGDRSGEAITRDNIAFVLRDVGQLPAAVASFRAAAACHLRRVPPDIKEAVRSLDLALGLALRARLRTEVLDLARQLDTLDPDDARKLLRQALVAWQTQAADAAVRYQRLSALAETLPPEPARLVRLLAQAGLVRSQAKPLFADCPGLVITQVVPASQAERLDLRPGDILRTYHGTCLHEPRDLISAPPKSQPDQPVRLERFRDGSSQTLTAQGGKLGVAVQAF